MSINLLYIFNISNMYSYLFNVTFVLILSFFHQIPSDHMHFLVLPCPPNFVTSFTPNSGKIKKKNKTDDLVLSIFSLEHGVILFMDCLINRIQHFPCCTPSISHQLWSVTLQHPIPFKSSLQCLHDQYFTFLGDGVSLHMKSCYKRNLPHPFLLTMILQS